jgi:hypothetical protein
MCIRTCLCVCMCNSPQNSVLLILNFSMYLSNYCTVSHPHFCLLHFSPTANDSTDRNSISCSRVKGPYARHEGVWRSSGISPLVLIVGTRLKVSGQLHAPSALPSRIEPTVPNEIRVWMKPQSRFGCSGEDKISCLC